MIKSLKARLDRREDEGFTLIELMVVVLIIAILMAIAIPTFLSARGTANQRAAQSNLRNAITTEQTLFTSNQAYTATQSTLAAAEPGLTWQAAWSPTSPATYLATGGSNGNPVYVEVGTSTTSPVVEVAALGADGKCYWEQDQNGQVGYAISSSAGQTSCSTSPAMNLFMTAWGGSTSAFGTGTSNPAGIS